MAYHSFEIYSGLVSLPNDCSGNRQLLCHLMNYLFEQGGYFAVAMINLGISLFVFVISTVLISDNTPISVSSGMLPINTSEPLKLHNENKPQTINDVLIEGQEPTIEFLEELEALHNAPDLSDHELEKQALHRS